MTVDPNVALPFASSVLSLMFSAILLGQWRRRHRPHQLIWATGMLWYGLSAGTEVTRDLRVPFTWRLLHSAEADA